MHNLLIFGGSFDPVHNAHLKIARTVQNRFNFESFVFLPCKIPLLKSNSIASSDQRAEMLSRALSEQPEQYHFTIDIRELKRASPSYTVTTLNDYRKKEKTELSITLLMAIDNFLQLPKWYKWEKILTLANIILVNRPGYPLTQASETIKNLLKTHQTQDTTKILQNTHGIIYHLDTEYLDLSSSYIRNLIQRGEDVSNLVPKSVFEYIQKYQIYS